MIELHDVVRRREKGDQVFELHVPELQVWRGEFVTLAGESGCGKSTLLDLLGLVLQPTSGRVFTLRPRVAGPEHDILGASASRCAGIRRADVGYVLQTGGLLPFLSVLENILLPCRVNRLSDRRESVLALCDRLGIGGQLGKKPAFLSGGQRQRAAIARALAHDPPLVLADEPTAAVDKLTAREICTTFRELTRRMGVTLLMVTHDVERVAGLTDRIFGFDVCRADAHTTVSTCRERA